MGSTGTGKFGNYDTNKDLSQNDNEKKSGINLQGENLCGRPLDNVILEDIEIYEYYLKNNKLPAIGDNIYLSKTKFKGRLVVADGKTNQMLGNLPTDYNYLFQCIQLGYSYNGEVIQSIEKPTARLMVRLNASK